VNPHPIAKQAQILVDVCSYTGTSNVLKVQEMLHHCTDHIKNKDGTENEDLKKDPAFQSFAVLGIALVAMGEDVGAEMALRTFNHLVSLLLHLVGLSGANETGRCTTATPQSGRWSLSRLV
jgi:26S proteasome regulatory subunit N1